MEPGERSLDRCRLHGLHLLGTDHRRVEGEDAGNTECSFDKMQIEYTGKRTREHIGKVIFLDLSPILLLESSNLFVPDSFVLPARGRL